MFFGHFVLVIKWRVVLQKENVWMFCTKNKWFLFEVNLPYGQIDFTVNPGLTCFPSKACTVKKLGVAGTTLNLSKRVMDVAQLAELTKDIQRVHVHSIKQFYLVNDCKWIEKTKLKETFRGWALKNCSN